MAKDTVHVKVDALEDFIRLVDSFRFIKSTIGVASADELQGGPAEDCPGEFP
jgi:uncharacterized protein (DUF4213/DUF364 family)